MARWTLSLGEQVLMWRYSPDGALDALAGRAGVDVVAAGWRELLVVEEPARVDDAAHLDARRQA